MPYNSESAETEWLIRTDDVCRSFGATKAVSSLNLRVPSGAVYGFLGPNGSGKTTTIRMLLGLIKPDQGGISLFGESLAKSREQLLDRVGALVEMPSLYNHLTGRENLEVTRRLTNAPRARISEALDTAGITSAADRLVKTYSLGMKQRLGLALCLMREPSLLILDEPTNGLDPAGIHEMRRLIHDLPARAGATVFLSSHLLNEVEQMASVVGIINKGKLLFQGTLDELRHPQSGSLSLTVDNPVLALQLLAGLGRTDGAVRDGQIEIAVSDPDEAASINAALVMAGIQVFEMTRRKRTLEHWFLELTGQPNSARNDE